MNDQSHRPKWIKQWGGRLIKATPFVSDVAMAFVRKRRVRRAAVFLEAGNFFPDSRGEVLADYTYSTSRTHRDVQQVLNLEAVLRYVEGAGIEGSFVETGTYTGGASAYALRALRRLRRDKPPRPYWGFDSFEGMPAPSKNDGDHGSLWVLGKRMDDAETAVTGALTAHDVNRADYDECLSYLRQTGYSAENIHLVKGWFQDSLRPSKDKIGSIAVLRMDGDFYESTQVVLDELYDQVVPGGVVIVDDYGSFQGCRKAIEEFFVKRKIQPHLVYIDNNMRYFVKPADRDR